MATIGLKIAEDPDTAGSLSLADTLAKATFGDPEGQMKARALASEVGVRMASRDKLLADTGLVNAKTKTSRTLDDAQTPPLVRPSARRTPPLTPTHCRSRLPVQVWTRAATGRSRGSSTQRLKMRDAIVAREQRRVAGPRAHPATAAKGVNKNYGRHDLERGGGSKAARQSSSGDSTSSGRWRAVHRFSADHVHRVERRRHVGRGRGGARKDPRRSRAQAVPSPRMSLIGASRGSSAWTPTATLSTPARRAPRRRRRSPTLVTTGRRQGHAHP